MHRSTGDCFAQIAPCAVQDFEPLRTAQDVESEVRDLARAGFNNKAIAGKLEIPPRAVKRILFVLYRETNVENADPVSRRYRLVARLNGAAGSFLDRAAQSAAD
jgi:DNA-binding NarL/FixJ family response regulator